LCAAVPSLLIALAVDAPAAQAYLRGHESQAQAMVQEGLLELETPSPKELEQRLKKLGVQKTEALASSLARLAADGVSDELLERFGAAAREREAGAPPTSQEGRARSKAEEFLYELLQALPATHGLFTLNQQAEFRINDRPVEVDFLSHRLRVAIEVDGYYHFREADNYRRDRRKDLALQRHGYLVLRFLADDVVERLEEIRDTVLEVISQRREAPGGSPPNLEGADGGE
jgi:very-short-patch-repair endonuclease